MSRRYFISENSKQNDYVVIEGSEHHHISKVMRYKAGDSLALFDGTGIDFTGEIQKITATETHIKITHSRKNESECDSKIDMYISLMKSDKFELVLQKAVELGINDFHTFISENTVIKNDNLKVERLKKIALEAVKQCGRSRLPEIIRPIKLKDAIDALKQYDKVFLAFENENENVLRNDFRHLKGGKVALIIGGEGGFNEREISEIKNNLSNLEVISLGKRILRAETAAIALTSVIIEKLGEWDI